jgi:hypothetical protein
MLVGHLQSFRQVVCGPKDSKWHSLTTDVNNNLLTEKLLQTLWLDRRTLGLKEPLSSIKLIAEWLDVIQSKLNFARMRTNKVVTAVNPNSGTVRKSNIASASAESSTSRRVNMSTAQNTRTTLAAITEVAEGQLLEFSDSDDDDILYPEEVDKNSRQ